ncbi:MEKHLA domain-containing protein [Novosphingobium sp. PC22D]|uniref:MEKHLA domain-containing protein n=1 Tax=Novosphingobium sp. PC22D TaxID=1962403 RepID=UPI000BF10240|nr:MEKHLA domain-containing protein [Novosphingobium sp. PC22D]PEQ11138.1 MEKHLA domain-containing protein [Novosphingobium sp. PC22D]
MDAPPLYREPACASRIRLIAQSHHRLMGKPLAEVGGDAVAALWSAPFALVAHGDETDPLFFFGNRVALERFGYSVEEFIGLPSRLSAEAPLRDERRRMLERVAERGYIDDYAGTRITRSGERFEISRALVWNLVDEAGRMHGQAARFAV